MSGYVKLFAAFSNEDRQRTVPAVRMMEARGFLIEHGGLFSCAQPWEEQLYRSFRRADGLLVFVTARALRRKKCYIRMEYDLADAMGLPVIAVFLDPLSECTGTSPEGGGLLELLLRGDFIETDDPALISEYIRCGAKLSEGIKSRAAVSRKPGANGGPEPEGEFISFGTFSASGSAPRRLRWRVLDAGRNRALVISEKTVGRIRFNGTRDNADWESCSLRSWLNGEFMRAAFDREETCRLITRGGTDDRIFCLSAEEAARYLPSPSLRAALPADTEAGLPGSGGLSWWWLRSDGFSAASKAYVNHRGDIRVSGCSVSNPLVSVRPAMNIALQPIRL